jgi:bacterioferritin
MEERRRQDRQVASRNRRGTAPVRLFVASPQPSGDAERILFLDGCPTRQSLEQFHIGQDVRKVLECDLAAEFEARTLYQEAAEYCHSLMDYPSRQLFEELMADEEGRIDSLETQLKTTARIGLELYSQAYRRTCEGGGLARESLPSSD